MTEKKSIFCIEYLKDFNATQAAIRTGYSEKTAYSQGQRLLKDVEIKKHIDKELNNIISEGKKYLEHRIKEELEKMAFDPMLDENSRLTHRDKIKSLELLGKYAAMFTDKVEHTVNDEAYIKLKELYAGN
jgi:phage terminase small subunit